MILKTAAATLLFFLLIAATPRAGGESATPSLQNPEISANSVEECIVARINRLRIKNGLRPLRPVTSLQEFARSQSMDMAENGYLDHVDSRGRSLEMRVKDARLDGWRGLGENMARGLGCRKIDEVMIKGWLSSPPHRVNILDREFDSTGVGVAKGHDGYFYATQIFMRSENRP